jgi:hypothetical protein
LGLGRSCGTKPIGNIAPWMNRTFDARARHRAPGVAPKRAASRRASSLFFNFSVAGGVGGSSRRGGEVIEKAGWIILRGM